MPIPHAVRIRRASIPLLLLALSFTVHGRAPAQDSSVPESPIAIVPIDSSVPDKAATVTGGLEIYNGRAFIKASGTITSGEQTTPVMLPHRGELRVCAMSSIKLAADSVNVAGETPGLLMAMDHGAVELSFASRADLKNADTLLTPDFRILIGGPGAADVKVRLENDGDTCVDNSSANGPYIVVSSVFDGGAYRVQPGQRVMFQHGSLNEVVDQEKESCGCPPPAPAGNEFPVAQSMGLAPAPKVAPEPVAKTQTQTQAQNVPPLVYKSSDHTQAVAIPEQPAQAAVTATAAPPKPAVKKKRGFFAKVGRFFRHIFGAED
jgi:hypothetical protein